MKIFLTILLCLWGFNASALISTNSVWVGANVLPATNALQVRTAIEALHGLEYTNYSSNAVTAVSPITVGGSSLPNVNGVYTMSYTNVGGGTFGNDLVVWTNASATYIIAVNDPDNPDFFEVVIETALGQAEPPYSGSYVNGLPSGFISAYGPADTITLAYSTNFTGVPFPYSAVSGSLFVPPHGTNLVVNQVIGNDASGDKTVGIPYLTLQGATAEAVAGDFINMDSSYYTNLFNVNATALPAKGVIIRGNGSKQSGNLTIVDNVSVDDLEMFTQPLVNITNANSRTTLKSVNVLGSTDYLIVDSVNGLFKNILSQMIGPWDGYIFNSVKSNSLVQLLYNNQLLQWTNGIEVNWGMHNIGYKVSNVSGAPLQVVGGVYANINSTNLVFSGTELQGNANLYIGQKSGEAAGYGNAAVALYFPVFIHGSTNPSVQVNAVSNLLNVPLTGGYFDVTAGADYTKPVTSSKLVIIDAVKIGTSAPPVASALLDLQSTTKGFLPPRMTSAQKLLITSPATGLFIYQTDSVAGYYYWNGSAWSLATPTDTDTVSTTGSITQVSSSTTPIDITGISASLTAGNMYSYEALIPFNTVNSAMGYKFIPSFTGTSTTFTKVYTVLDTTSVVNSFYTVGATACAGAFGTGNGMFTVKGSIFAVTSGTLTIQMAQNVSDAQIISVSGGGGAYLKVRRIYP